MSTIDQISNLRIDEAKKDKQFHKMEEALIEYHKLVDSGIIKVRENKIQQIYISAEYSFCSNYNRDLN